MVSRGQARREDESAPLRVSLRIDLVREVATLEEGCGQNGRCIRQPCELHRCDGIMGIGGGHVARTPVGVSPCLERDGMVFLQPGKGRVQDAGDVVLVSHSDERCDDGKRHRDDLIEVVVRAADVKSDIALNQDQR